MAKMDWLPWLEERWGKVTVPDVVWRELLKIGDAAALARLESARKSRLIDVEDAPPLSRAELGSAIFIPARSRRFHRLSNIGPNG